MVTHSVGGNVCFCFKRQHLPEVLDCCIFLISGIITSRTARRRRHCQTSNKGKMRAQCSLPSHMTATEAAETGCHAVISCALIRMT